MTFDQLRYFQAVCRYDGVSRAARALNISQPSISNAIRNLEREFGVILFDRQHKRLSLTKEGQQLRVLADGLLQQVEEVNQAMQAMGQRSKVLRLGVPPMIGSLILPVLYASPFGRDRQLRIFENDSSGLKQLLADDQIDMAFIPHTGPIADLNSERLTQLQNVCCVNRKHPLAGRDKVKLDELADEPLVLFKNSFFQTERILDAFAGCGCTPRVLLTTAQLSTVQKMIQSNMAVGFLFAFLAESSEELVGIPLDPPMTTQVSLVWKHSCQMSDDMRSLIQLVRDLRDQ